MHSCEVISSSMAKKVYFDQLHNRLQPAMRIRCGKTRQLISLVGKLKHINKGW